MSGLHGRRSTAVKVDSSRAVILPRGVRRQCAVLESQAPRTYTAAYRPQSGEKALVSPYLSIGAHSAVEPKEHIPRPMGPNQVQTATPLSYGFENLLGQRLSYHMRPGNISSEPSARSNER